MGEAAAKGCDLFTPAQLLACYEQHGDRHKVTKIGLGKALRRRGIKQVGEGKCIRTHHGVVRLYAVRNGDKWAAASAGECGVHFNEFFEKGKVKF
jgi:hypothetical protein